MRISDWSSDVCSSDLHAIIDVRPFGMMVHFLGDDRDARHEAERLREIGEGEAARDRVARRLVRPFGEACEQRGARGIVEFPDHLLSPAGKGRAPAMRKGAMSDKTALRDPPAGWAGTAPDADAFHAMAEAALAALPDMFKPHIEGVVVAIEEVADDATPAAPDIEPPYDLTGLYEEIGRASCREKVGQSG